MSQTPPARRRKQVVLSLLALLLAFSSVELCLHSVHHLGDPHGASTCPVLSVSQHVPGAVAEPSVLRAPTLAPLPAVAAVGERILPARFSRPGEGRAPPQALSSV